MPRKIKLRGSVVKLLLEKGADITVETVEGWTPLYAAFLNGHVDANRHRQDRCRREGQRKPDAAVICRRERARDHRPAASIDEIIHTSFQILYFLYLASLPPVVIFSS